MTLQAVVSSLDTVPEALRGEYKKADDGKFYLDVSGVDDMPAVIGLKRKNTELLDEKKKVDDKLKAYGDDTPEKVAEYKAAASGKEPKDVKALQEKLEQVSTNAQKEIAAAKDEATAAAKRAEDYFVDSEISRVLADPEVKGSVELLAHVMRPSIRVKTVDGKFSSEIIKDGTARIKDAAANPFTLKDFALELRGNPLYGRAFDASGKGGSGAVPGGGQIDPNATSVKAGDDGIVRVDAAQVLAGKVSVVQ